MEIAAFATAMDACIEEGVDFILVAGDLFHANIPDLAVVNEAVKRMKQVRDRGIPFYVAYGSHDYSPTETSIIDILQSAGLITKIMKATVEDDKVKLHFTTDPKTGAKIAGLSGRKLGLEREYFEILDRTSLEKAPGFKIFTFHSAIAELKPEYLARMDAVPASYLPKGFAYYAGGHLHEKLEGRLPGLESINYPGPLFSGYPRDLEQIAQGTHRGFFVVHFDDQVEKVEFREIPTVASLYFEYDAGGKSAAQAKQELLSRLQKLEVQGKLAVLKIRGQLSGGSTAEINSSEIRAALYQKGALYVTLNKHGVTSREFQAVKVAGEDIPTIENALFRENIGTVKVATKALQGDSGVRLATGLLKLLRQEPKPNEKKKDYEERVIRGAIQALHLEERGT